MNSFSKFREDLKRHYGLRDEGSPVSKAARVFFTEGAWATGAFRFAHWARCEFHLPVLGHLLIVASVLLQRTIAILTGIYIGVDADIGPGLFIGHFGNIWISPGVRMGSGCNISNGVTIGMAGRGKKRGYPVLGDRVYIGPNAVLVGRIRIGDNVVVSPNSLVVTDIADNNVVVGVPARSYFKKPVQ